MPSRLARLRMKARCDGDKGHANSQGSAHPISDHQGNDQGHHRGHNSQQNCVVKAQDDYLGGCLMYRGIALSRSAENCLKEGNPCYNPHVPGGHSRESLIDLNFMV